MHCYTTGSHVWAPLEAAVRRALPRPAAAADEPDRALHGRSLLQVALVSRAAAYVSLASVRLGPLGWLYPLPFAAGAPPVPRRPAAPSRAHAKLAEALALLGAPRPAHCLDLGAAPGGWAHLLLALGASSVLSVDRCDT